MSIEVTCPQCGTTIQVKGTGGRKPKNIPVTFVCDKLRFTGNVKQAAEELGCSRGYIYKVLKAAGLDWRRIINSQTKSQWSRQDGSYHH